jgi:hypothetical protein
MSQALMEDKVPVERWETIVGSCVTSSGVTDLRDATKKKISVNKRGTYGQ